MNPDQLIIAFLKSQTVLTLATAVFNKPYCATCFYAYSEQSNVLIFKSSKDTVHVQNGLQNNLVSGSILPDRLIAGKVKGVQFSGVFSSPDAGLLDEAKKKYYKKYPFALAVPGEIWVVRLNALKFTDNTLGFGKKLIWEFKTES